MQRSLAGAGMDMRVAIDIVPIAAGHGGTGSGIWTYAENLLLHLDRCAPPDMEIVVIARPPQIQNLKSQITNLRLFPVPWPCKGVLSRLLWVHVYLPWLCWRRGIDVLHKLATEVPVFCPVQRVTTVHDFYYEFLWENTRPKQRRWYERLEAAYFSSVTRISFHKCATLLTDSRAVLQEAQHRYPLAASKMICIPLGAPLPSASPPSPLSPQPFRIIYPAKLMAYKGQRQAIAAVEKLLADHPELRGQVQMVFRGYANDRQYERSLRQQAAHSPAAAHFQFAAYEHTKSSAEIYRGFQAVMLLSQYEGFGLPVIEAQSQGLPVICSDLPVLREVAGADAVFVQPDRPAEVAMAIFQLMTDRHFYQTLVARGQNNAARFRWERAAQQTLAVYRQVAER